LPLRAGGDRDVGSGPVHAPEPLALPPPRPGDADRARRGLLHGPVAHVLHRPAVAAGIAVRPDRIHLPEPGCARGLAVPPPLGFAIALIPTMVAISLFLAGLPRIGAARSSLLSTWEPVVTVLLAVVLLGDRLSLVQVLGGVLVLLAVGVVQSASLWKRSAPSAIK